MSDDRLHLSLVTPERALIDEYVDAVQVPGLGGYLGILPGHAPLFSELAAGELTYAAGGGSRSVFVAGGFVEIVEDEVRVLADCAEKVEEIDVERAERARARAEERIARGGDAVDHARARAALDRALARIQVASKRGRTAA